MLLIPILGVKDSGETDEEFITKLFLENETAMFLAAYQILQDYHTARDMVSEACIVMIKHIKMLRRIQVPRRPWYIVFIVKDLSRMYLRRKKRENYFLQKNEEKLMVEDVEREDVYTRLILEAEMAEVHEVLSKINERDRELLEMRYFAGLTDEEIASRIGIAAVSVRGYLTKARRTFAKKLKRSEQK